MMITSGAGVSPTQLLGAMIVMRMLRQVDDVDQRYDDTQGEDKDQQTDPGQVAIRSRPVDGTQRGSRDGTHQRSMSIHQHVVEQSSIFLEGLFHISCRQKFRDY